jgi:hypothetical protein
MNDFSNADTQNGLSVKLWRGERMALIGMDVDQPEPDFVGFSIEVKSPGSADFQPLRNRINFQYDQPAVDAVTGFRNFPSPAAPFQKFRWVHFPYDPKDGIYTYRVTKQHMKPDGTLRAGTSFALDIPLEHVTYDDYLDVGFARNFASSQAFQDKFAKLGPIIPADKDAGLTFQKVAGDVYSWLGFEAYELIFGFLDQVRSSPELRLDVFAYDLNEPDIVARLVGLENRVRIIIDDSADHKPDTSAESQAAARIRQSAGAGNVKRMHFGRLQHNKVFIARKKNGDAVKVLFGSTNFSFRGIYIQANNVLVFSSPDAAGLFAKVFDTAFNNPAIGTSFGSDASATQWFLVQPPGKPPVRFCFSPHGDTDLSLNPVGAAIDQATSSVFFCIAFLNQATNGAVRDAVDRLQAKRLFSYGISNEVGNLEVRKPDGSLGIVDFEYLSSKAPEPFKTEWSGGSGIHEHHKFVVTDFSLPTAKVFTGSSNLSVSGERNNGDNLVMIEDPRVATGYAIEAVRIFDHLQFRTLMKEAAGAVKMLTLQKPPANPGEQAWFAPYYVKDTQRDYDRKLFSH